jgi:hypothetical protein
MRSNCYHTSKRVSLSQFQYRLLAIGIVLLAWEASSVEFNPSSLSRSEPAQECSMNKDDLSKTFSGPEMASFSQFSEKGIVEEDSVVLDRGPFSSDDKEQILNSRHSVEGGGGFDFIIRQEPSQLNEKTDRRVGFALRSIEWSSLFFETLGCPLAEPYVASEDIEVWTANRRIQFERAIPKYPLLARLWDPFRNVWYSPDEILALKNECEIVEGLDSNTDFSKAGLRKIEAACNEALSTGLGLYLVSD